MKKSSIKDVAKKANVSIGTVDRVLHKRGQVSESTKKRVLEVIEELRYEPNTIARSLASKKRYKIGVLLPEPVDENSYWYYPNSGIRKALLQQRDFQVDLISSYFEINSVDDFKKKAEQLIQQNPDGIISTPLFKEELESFIHVFDSKKIKYTLLDSDLENSSRSFFIGQNTLQSGRVAAQLIDFSLGRVASTILILRIYSVSQGAPTIQQREQGFIEYFKEVHPDQHIVHESIEYELDEDFTGRMKSVLSAHQNVSAIFVPNSKAYLVASHLKSIYSRKPVLLGFDALEENRLQLKEGQIDFLISQRPITQGFQVFHTLLKVLIEKTETHTTKEIPIDIITRENLSAYDHLSE